MLKKIVKYGNSSALVLDKALLELLDMAEGSVVKIKTDGVSLIITPQNVSPQNFVSPTLTIEDCLSDAATKAFEQSFGDAEKARAYQAELREICDRYAKLVKDKMDTPEIRLAIANVQKRFVKDETNPEYAKQIQKVQLQHAPELENMHQEMDALLKKYSLNIPDSNMKQLTAEFGKVHEKYKHLFKAVTALSETPEHIHEMMLLSEKYQLNKDAVPPKEYFEAYIQLISKDIPEYALYQDELKKVGELFNR